MESKQIDLDSIRSYLKEEFGNAFRVNQLSDYELVAINTLIAK